MPNVIQMEDRMRSHLARVSGKAVEKEFDRIDALWHSGKVSNVTRTHMKASAALRLAWRANAA